MDSAKAETQEENLLVHPTAWKNDGENWTVEARCSGVIIVNGKTYEFDEVVLLELTEIK